MSNQSLQKKNREDVQRGLSSLLGNISTINSSPQLISSNRIPLHLVTVNPNQPRTYFDEESLQELATSIKLHDIIQPITVTKLSDGKYQLISGERRLRAATIAGLKDIPAFLREVGDNDLLELALLENVQRENLNPIEIALSYRRMIDELNYTQEKIAERMGVDRTLVSHYIRLLKLPPVIQESVKKEEITMGHARTLIGIEEIDRQLFVFNEVKEKNLNVRQTEALVKQVQVSPKKNIVAEIKKEERLNPAYKKLEDTLCSHFETKVVLNHRKNGEGVLEFHYQSLNDLNNLLDKLRVDQN
ncbi:MAG: ParB/RepB/Spo0J family partition protein [Sediminibacterium sp.]|nr:ParB/RepB/Spo0J family partition protein [Sediminibacterium sp.]